MSATALCHVLPSFRNILCSFLDTSAPGLSQQSRAVHLLLLPSTSCLLSLLICMVIPSYIPSWPLWSVPCHHAECLAEASLLHRQAGHLDITCWLNSQHCLLGTGHQKIEDAPWTISCFLSIPLLLALQLSLSQGSPPSLLIYLHLISPLFFIFS